MARRSRKHSQAARRNLGRWIGGYNRPSRINRIAVARALGLPDEHVFTVALADLDHEVEPDHLTSLFVDTGQAAVGPELARLLALTERLRGPGGCPWDAKQTHHSLRRHVLEEAYEVVEAIEEHSQ